MVIVITIVIHNAFINIDIKAIIIFMESIFCSCTFIDEDFRFQKNIKYSNNLSLL